MTAVNRNKVRSHSHSAHKNSSKAVKKQIRTCIASLFIIIACCVVFGNLYSLATDKHVDKDIQYTSICIEKGDTLWSIAEEYITDEYETVPQYIKEIKKINGLTSDSIQSGMNLIVEVDTYNPLTVSKR